MTRKPLVVYKASAGSGKTFTLAVEYIKLLIKNPLAYQSILAVTFTNKATEEMKMRILSQLYGIWKQLPDSESYLQKIAADLEMPLPAISERAGKALQYLLHNYNYFNVETIDAFFQTVLRNLARELNLTTNLRVELNDTQVEEQAVDVLIENLTHTDLMLQWLLKYIMETISDDKSWNVIGQVKQFGRTIFRDYYKDNSQALKERMDDSHFFDSYMAAIKEVRDNAAAFMKEIAESFFDALASESLSVEDLSYGSTGVAGFFIKLRNGIFDESIIGKRVTDCQDDIEKWYKKKHPQAERIHYLVENELMQLLDYAIKEREQQWRLYKSAELTLRHLYQLRLLGNIEQQVRRLNEEGNRFLLSDTQQLLGALMKDTDAPFIYEKIGTRIKHIMIDEFQDTSVVQWKNFKVLLEECMSHAGSENLIVGDVKQSIYRWRAGDWRLLNHIGQQFDNAAQRLQIENLGTNYRSASRVVAFNNAFFETAVQIEHATLQETNEEQAQALLGAYSDVEQKSAKQQEQQGYVSVKLLAEADYVERTLSEIGNNVQRLIDCGTEPGQIAIIVRTNGLIAQIANYFLTNYPQLTIVSDEAFRLDASLAVNIIVQAIQLIAHPDDKLAKAFLVKAYQQVVQSGRHETEMLLRTHSLDEWLPEQYIKRLDALQSMSLYDLAEKLYDLFQLYRLPNENAYCCLFFDLLNAYALEKAADMDAFLKEWEENLCRKTIQSDEINGIRLISIHKSKGLEFDSVILPFCDWQLEKPTGNLIWCSPTEEPFAQMPLLPIDYNQKLIGTIYEQDYLDEHLQYMIDNLNLLYVALTRACNNLLVIGKQNAKNSRSQLLQAALPDTASHLEGARYAEDDDTISFEYGQMEAHRHRARQSANVFLSPVATQQIAIQTFDNQVEFKQSNQSRDFVCGDDDDVQTAYIKTGSILHEVFSRIRTTGDIERVLRQMQSDGIIYDDQLTAERLMTLIRKRLEDPRVANWFSEKWQLFNECTILSMESNGRLTERRPDRVMTDGQQTIVVDFKFGKPKAEYPSQVHEYMELLTRMGHQQVSGYLWYVYNNKIERV